MLDRQFREVAGPVLESLGCQLARRGVTPGTLTAVGWLAGVGACLSAAGRLWSMALILWLVNRLFDGLDGPVARAVAPTLRGGFFDIVADFSVYGGFVVGVAIGVPTARLACLVLLFTYYVSGTVFLAATSLLTARSSRRSDNRSFRFIGGLAEGGETVLVYVLFCLWPHSATMIAWVFALVVAITAVQRVVIGVRLLASDNLAVSPDYD